MHHTDMLMLTGVCQLTWIERKLAATLFAEPPSAKIEQALEEFRCAEELAPKTNKANQLYLAKVCCIFLFWSNSYRVIIKTGVTSLDLGLK